ncbi:MAG: phage tail tape measure protein, partial [Acidobacteria bacterium]|nr:phage tail tape measure protein [Acidobacteriota bacterium]
VGAITSAIKSTADHLDALDEMAVKTGVSVEMLTSLELAAKQNGVSMDQLATSIRMMYRSMNEAAEGTKKSADAYKRLGVNVRDASGKLKSGNEAFLEVADAVAKIQNPAERSAMAMKVFGRAGSEMLPMLEGGKEALKGYIDEARRLGLIYTDEDAKRGAAFNDQLDAFTKVLTRLKETVAMWPMKQMTKVMAMITGSDLPDVVKMDVRIDQISDLQKKISDFEKRMPYFEKAAANPKREFMRGYYENKLKEKNEELRSMNNELATLVQDYQALDAIKANSGKTDDGGGGGGVFTPKLGGLMAMTGRPTKTKEEADIFLNSITRMNPKIGKVKRSVGELVPAFQKVATTIDTSVTLGDKLVAPFEAMMIDIQGAWANTISEFLKGGQTFGEFMQNVFENVLDSFINMISQMAAQQLAGSIFSGITGLKYNAAGVGANYASMQGGTTININAVDAASFETLARRNAGVITGVVWEQQQYGRAM